ncbi:MAG: ribonuclease H-like domain-containing protein [Enhydrobacter sp.]|nr:MAG: ribonuclease H-like domain-containing protein [Enhydrobacter sp.]
MAEDAVLVFDIEAVPDVRGFAVAERLESHPDWSVRKQMGEKVARQLFQRIVCIGSLRAVRRDGVWRIESIEAPHAGEASEPEMIERFAGRFVGGPLLVSFNGHTFDLPVLRYRAMLNAVSLPGLAARRYFDRSAADSIDLCDLLSGQERHARASLDELSRLLGLPGKQDGMDGGAVEEMFDSGRHAEIAAYCRSDVVNTYRVWLRYELFCGRLNAAEFAASERDLG